MLRLHFAACQTALCALVAALICVLQFIFGASAVHWIPPGVVHQLILPGLRSSFGKILVPQMHVI